MRLPLYRGPCGQRWQPEGLVVNPNLPAVTGSRTTAVTLLLMLGRLAGALRGAGHGPWRLVVDAPSQSCMNANGFFSFFSSRDGARQ